MKSIHPKDGWRKKCKGIDGNTYVCPRQKRLDLFSLFREKTQKEKYMKQFSCHQTSSNKGQKSLRKKETNKTYNCPSVMPKRSRLLCTDREHRWSQKMLYVEEMGLRVQEIKTTGVRKTKNERRNCWREGESPRQLQQIRL